jgi:tripartite-type tricarboxylate transporter receptor subunit TctC
MPSPTSQPGAFAMIIEGSGSIKLIAVASAKRLAEFPVSTVAETVADFQATGWAVLVAPVGTSEAITDKISEDLRKVTLDPELQKKLAPLGATPIPCRPRGHGLPPQAAGPRRDRQKPALKAP